MSVESANLELPSVPIGKVSPHTDYWKEVTRQEFIGHLEKMFGVARSEQCVGFWDYNNHRPHRPRIRVGDNYIVISQETAIYADFKIDWSTGSTCYCLHNYSFWV